MSRLSQPRNLSQPSRGKAEGLRLGPREGVESASQLAAVADLNQALRELLESVAIFPDFPARDNLLDCARKLLALKNEWRFPLRITGEMDLWAAARERGWQCVRLANCVGARAAYEEALIYRAEDAFVHHALGFSFLELGKLDDATRAWLRVLELVPNYDFAQFQHFQRSEDDF